MGVGKGFVDCREFFTEFEEACCCMGPELAVPLPDEGGCVFEKLGVVEEICERAYGWF